MNQFELLIDEYTLDVLKLTQVPHRFDTWMIERIPIPKDQVRWIMDSCANPGAELIYWAHQFEWRVDD